MYSRPARGKVPEYPRLVPAIDVEDIPICEDTVVYEHWSDDAEREAGQRAKKRQKRRQEAAEIYLRGGEVSILTAGLKGPFEGWRNPWAKKRQKREDTSGLEVPETTARTTRAARLPAARLDAGKGSQRDPIDLDDDEVVPIEISTSRAEPVDPFGAKNRIQTITLPGQAASSTKRVEDWLKTSEVYARRPRSHAGSSPTPAARPPTRERIFPPPRSSPIPEKPRSQEGVAAQGAPPAELEREAPASRPGSSSSVPSHESPQRAEAAILEHKEKSLHTVPPSTNLPAFEYRRPRRHDKKDSSNQQRPESAASKEMGKIAPARVNAPEEQLETNPVPPPEQVKPEAKLNSKPALSTETSKTSTVHNLPSAQVTSALNRGPAVSNAPSTNDMLQELSSTTRSGVHVERSTKTGENTTSTSAGAVEENPSKHQSEDNGPDKVVAAADAITASPSHHETPVRELATQEMIAAIKPFEFSTIKRPTAGFMKWQSSATATKVQPAKPSKRASFAVEHPLSDDSQKSIKAGLKVKKVTTAGQGEKVAPKVPLFEEASISAAPVLQDVNIDLLNESLPSISSMFGAKKGSAPKSILKSSNAISSAPVLSGNTTSTSMRQEAQIPSGQPRQKAMEVDMVNEDDSFDLDAAIDDLGSYLGTWDAEEEAETVAAAT